MDQLDLQAFKVLARKLHFARSAEELNLSPSAFTRRIQGIEAEVGQPLLIRTRRSVSLNSAGKRLLEYCQNQELLYSKFLEELQHEQREPSGQLQIACTVTACHSLLPALLATFRASYPRINLKLLTQDADSSLAQLKAGEVDLAVIPTESSAKDISALKLGSTEFSCIAPLEFNSRPAPAAAPALEQLLKDSVWVAPLGGLERKRLETWRLHFAPHSTIGAEVRGNEGIIAMVSLGMGIAFVPTLVLQNSPLKQRVRQLKVPEGPQGYDISLCSLSHCLEQRAVRLFWKLAEEQDNSAQ